MSKVLSKATTARLLNVLLSLQYIVSTRVSATTAEQPVWERTVQESCRINCMSR
jgi:hypothetical protein